MNSRYFWIFLYVCACLGGGVAAEQDLPLEGQCDLIIIKCENHIKSQTAHDLSITRDDHEKNPRARMHAQTRPDMQPRLYIRRSNLLWTVSVAIQIADRMMQRCPQNNDIQHIFLSTRVIMPLFMHEVAHNLLRFALNLVASVCSHSGT